MYQKYLRNSRDSSGFTLIEIIVVMLLTGMLLATTSLSLFRSQQRASITTFTQQVASDIKQQQTLAMNGKTAQNGTLVSYSIHFETHSYTVFPGLVYSSDNPENIVIPIDTVLSFTNVTFPSATLSFSRMSGDVVGFASGQNSVTIYNSQTGESQQIYVNKRGTLSFVP